MTTPREGPIPIFLDCDTGIDDALALAYLLADPGVQVVGIGTVSGNIDATKAAENTLALLELAGRTDIPVAVGAIDPLVGRFGGGAPEVHGQDGVGGVGLKPAATRTVDATAIALAGIARRRMGRDAARARGRTVDQPRALSRRASRM